MSRIMRRSAQAIALCATALLLVSCGNSPNKAASAAIVGNEAIPLQEVQEDLSWLLNNDSEARQYEEEGRLDLISRQLVESRVNHELLEVAAQRHGLSADTQEVQELIDTWGGRSEAPATVNVAPDQLDEFATDVVLLQDLGEQFVDGLSVDIVGTEIVGESPEATVRDQAVEVGEQIAAEPERAAELAGQDGRVVIEETLATRELVGTQASPLANTALFSAQPGTVAVIQPSTEQPVWLVALITDRSVDDSDGAGSDEQSGAADADPQLLLALGTRMLAPIADELGVEINPRYGVWDQAGMTIAESEEHVAGRLIPARTVEP